MDEKQRKERADRLRKARIAAGYETATEAAKAFGWERSAYISHENGTRGILPDTAAKYAPRFRTTPEFILYNRKKGQGTEKVETVPLIGRVSAGARAYFTEQGQEEVRALEGSTESTVAVEVEGDSLGPAFNGWLVYYDDVHNAVREDHIGQLCVVGLFDGRILVKIVQRARGKQGYFHLLPNASGEPAILDVEVEWAARVLGIKPRRI